jgi:hypothetical protein
MPFQQPYQMRNHANATSRGPMLSQGSAATRRGMLFSICLRMECGSIGNKAFRALCRQSEPNHRGRSPNAVKASSSAPKAWRWPSISRATIPSAHSAQSGPLASCPPY